MKCNMKSLACCLAATALSAWLAESATAVPLTLNLVPAESHITIDGTFSGIPSSAQDDVAGTIDYNPASPSNRTTFQGTITVDVDNALAPTSIQILSSNADADLSGSWFAQVRTEMDLNGNGDTGEFGLPPEGDSEVGTANNFGPAADADWGLRFIHPALGAPVAYGGYRGIAYNVTSGVENIDGLGQFFSTTQHFEPDGALHYWVAPAGGGLAGWTEANTGDGDFYDNLAGESTYAVTPLGGGASLLTLTIPIMVDDMGEVLRSVYTGQFVATLIIPEPTTIASLVVAGGLALLIGGRKRR
jgi:hypothetical protein